MAFAFLSKGPGGILLPLLTMLIALTLERRSWRFWVLSVILPLAAVGFWLGFLMLDPVAKTALQAELSATFVNTAHRNPLPYYIYTLPLLMMPGMLWAFRKAVRPVPPIAWIWLVTGLILLTITVSKQQHYALMLIPPAAWILSTRVTERFATRGSFPLLAVICLVIGLSAGLLVHIVGEDGKHARFLKHISAELPDQGTLHVVGINSATFDFHLGRHVDNLDSAQAALRRAQPGEAVVIVQKRKRWDAEDHPYPLLSQADDDTWIRRAYLIADPPNPPVM